ncbi:MAG: PHP domain-containing protein [Sarcina sp.]
MMKENINFASLHNHTHYSNIKGMRDSIIREDKLIDTAYNLGYKAVAITDHSCVSSHYKALEYYNKRYIDKDFKLILGEEIYLIDNIEETREVKGKYYHMVLLAKTKKGHEGIRKISSKSWDNSYLTGKLERTPIEKNQLKEIMEEYKGDIICTSACLGSELSSKILSFVNSKTQESKVDIHNFITWCINVFGKEDYFVELQPNDDVDQVLYNDNAITIAKAYGLGFIISTDSHYTDENKRKIHSAFINANSDKEANERDEFYKTSYMMTVEEMWNYCKLSMSYEDFKIAMENTIYIANRCEKYSIESPVKIPKRKLPKFELKHLFEKYYDKYEYIKNFSESNNEQDRFFLHLVEEGFINRNQEFNDINIKRIDDEMEVLWEISIKLNENMASYYNMMNLLIDICWEDGDSLIGVSRGSGTGFYTGYLLSLCQINAIEHNLPYWRHLSKERPELGDWDFDSENSKRKKILEAFKNHFNNGSDNVLNIGTFKTEGSRSTIQTCCRGMNINSDVANAMASMVKSERGQQWTIEDMLYGNEKKERKPITEFKNIVSEFEGLEEALIETEGLIVGKSVHASGIFIYEDGYLKENNALMKTSSGVEITSFDMNDSTNLGNLKFDALTIEALDKIRVCMDLLVRDGYMKWRGTLKKTYDQYLHPDVLDYNTKEMWDMLGEGTILDVFQFQTSIGIQTINSTRPNSLEQLAHANSLMRLSCDGNETPTQTFIRYKNDINEWYRDMEKHGLTKKDMLILEPHLLNLSGIASTQEDVMEMSMNKQISGFTETEANKLRKGISKKVESQIAESKELFFKKGKCIGRSEEFLNYVWNEQFGKQFGLSVSSSKS